MKDKKKLLPPCEAALGMQKDLLHKALADWPRRAAPLLAVNCGCGEFLTFLWQAGFDLIATEPEDKKRAEALEVKLPGLSVLSADDWDLPFENENFDWVILHLRNDAKKQLEKTLNEGLRVTRRGLMFMFWNTSSVPLTLWRTIHQQNWPLEGASWYKVWYAIHKLNGGKIQSFANLAGPVWTWNKGMAYKWLNRQLTLLPFGAWAIIRVDCLPANTVTPLALRIDAPMNNGEGVMEWAHKQLAHQGNRNR